MSSRGHGSRAVFAVVAMVIMAGCGIGTKTSSSLSGGSTARSGAVVATATPASAATITTAALQLADLPGYWTVAAPWSVDGAEKLAQDRSDPGCQPESVAPATSAQGQEGFTLSVDPGNHAQGSVTEEIIMLSTTAVAAGEHAYTRSSSWALCIRHDVTTMFENVVLPGLPTAISESPIPFPLPPGVTGYRFTDSPPRECRCPPQSYDVIDLQIRTVRVILDLVGSPIPEGTEVSVITNASVRLAASQGVGGMGTETRFTHPQAINNPDRLPSDFATAVVEAGGTRPPIPWNDVPSDGEGSLAVIPGGVAFTVYGYHQEWLSAPARGFTYDRTDATVTVSSGYPAMVGLGCESDKDFHGFDFAIADPNIWMIVQLGPNGAFEQTLMQGTTSAMNPTTSANQLSAECDSLPSGQTHLIFAVNRSVVAETTIAAGPQALWLPGLYIYGLTGPATADFTKIVQTAR